MASGTPGQGQGGSTRGAHALRAPEGGAEASALLPEDNALASHGALELSFVTNKAPGLLMQELQRSATSQRVSHRKASASLLRCERQAVRFEVEILRHSQNPAQFLVRSRRLAGTFNAYKELCSRVLADTRP